MDYDDLALILLILVVLVLIDGRIFVILRRVVRFFVIWVRIYMISTISMTPMIRGRGWC